MKKTIAIVMGGGRGTRLQPLTAYRSKPAVPLAGKYRLIDIPLSNCINSGLRQIYVLTQFLSVSLHRHIRGTYRFDNFSGGFVEILAAQQTMDPHGANRDWYQGTADAVRKNLRYLKQPGIENVLILSGDQLYRMDYAEMLATHRESGADVTIATKPVARSEASALGIMRINETGKVVGFSEKPKTDAELNAVAMNPAWIEQHGIASDGRDCLASMGIYMFNRDVLVDLLENSTHEDFGKEVFPSAIESRHVQVHLFDDYWEDIGTIRSFYDANLELTHDNPPFDLTSQDFPIYSRARFLPATRVDGAMITQSLIADGCVIEPGATIENSIIGLRCRIGRNVIIRNSVIMGADYYETNEQLAEDQATGTPSLGIGDDAVIERAIVDKNCRIGRKARVVCDSDQPEQELNSGCVVRDGVLVVPKDATLADGWKPIQR